MAVTRETPTIDCSWKILLDEDLDSSYKILDENRLACCEPSVRFDVTCLLSHFTLQIPLKIVIWRTAMNLLEQEQLEDTDYQLLKRMCPLLDKILIDEHWKDRYDPAECTIRRPSTMVSKINCSLCRL